MPVICQEKLGTTKQKCETTTTQHKTTRPLPNTTNKKVLLQMLHWLCYLWQTAKMWKSISEITMADIESLEVLGAHIDLVATHPQFFTIKNSLEMCSHKSQSDYVHTTTLKFYSSLY